MAASRLPALARKVFVPDEHPCCLCRKPNAARGFGERFYCTPCVPPPMRFPWEAGYVPPETDLAAPAPIAAPAQAAFDLMSGFAPA